MSEACEAELVARLRAANTRLRGLLAAKDAELAAVGSAKDAENAELRVALKALTLRVAELERRLGSGSDDSGTPSSKEPIAAKARRNAERKARRERVEPPQRCRGCGGDLDEGQDAGTAWSQCWDVRVIPWRIEYLLPRRSCGCGTTTTAPVNGICYGPVLNTAAIALTAFGNVPTERAAHLVAMLTGQGVSPGFVDRANARLAEQLTGAGFDRALLAALLAEPVLTADETPVEVVTPAVDPTPANRCPVPGAPHVLVQRPPDERLVRLTAADSRRHDEVIASLRTFTGYLIVDGYGAYQKLLPVSDTDRTHTGQAEEGGLLAGIQQCCQHVFRRRRDVAKLGPGSLQSWATDVRGVLADAHELVQAARARGQTALAPHVPAGLRARYDKAVTTGIIHNRHRDWDGNGNHPGYALASWLHKHAEQIWSFTTNFAVEWTSNAAERGVKPAKRHQAVSGYWQTDRTLARWCRINSYLTSARNHGLTSLDAITRALAAAPWLPAPITAQGRSRPPTPEWTLPRCTDHLPPIATSVHQPCGSRVWPPVTCVPDNRTVQGVGWRIAWRRSRPGLSGRLRRARPGRRPGESRPS